MDELDRILSEEQTISPPAGFSRRVMAAVHQEASTPAPIPFPWRYLLATFGAMAVAVIGCALLAPLLPPSAVAAGAALQQGLSRLDSNLLAWSSGVVFVAIAVVRYSVQRVFS